MTQVIGIDIGGTFIKGGLVRDGAITRKVEYPTNASKGTEAFVRTISAAINDLRKGSKAKAIGIASAGAIDIKRGVVINSPNTPQKNYPLRDVLRKEHKLPVHLDNDANCFTLAEATLGSAKKYGIVAGITLGTGVGGGLVINKKIYHGRGSAGEFGHITLDYNGWEGPTGLRGGLEEYAGSRGVMRLARMVSGISPKHVFQLAEDGNKDAKAAWEKYGEYLGIGVANVVYAVDPEAVVIGGQISKAWKYFNSSMKKKAQQSCFFSMPPIVRASTTSAGILGAAMLCGKR